MRFQVLTREEHSEHDTDIETAVELVHYSSNETLTNIQSENGLRFAIKETRTSKFSTHLEPCFDESNFTPGDPVHYVPTDSPDGPQESVEIQAFAYRVLSLPEMSEADWGVYQQHKDTLGWEDPDTGIPDDQARRLCDYQEYQDNFHPVLGEAYTPGHSLPLNAGLFQAVASVSEGKSVEVQVNVRHMDLILALEHMQSTQREENAHNRSLNQVSLSVWEAKQAIGEQVAQARKRFNP